jgi:hypothetical protein
MVDFIFHHDRPGLFCVTRLEGIDRRILITINPPAGWRTKT